MQWMPCVKQSSQGSPDMLEHLTFFLLHASPGNQRSEESTKEKRGG